MKRRTSIRNIAIPRAVSFLPALILPAAGWLAIAGDEFTIRNEVRLVLLDVSVQDHNGNFVPGLAKTDFSVSENGRPQIISVFDNEDAPVTIGILVDESASMTPKRRSAVRSSRLPKI